MKTLIIALLSIVITTGHTMPTDSTKKVTLTPEQLMQVNDSLMKTIGLNDSIAKAQADSLQKIALEAQKQVIENPESTGLQKLFAWVSSALLLLLGFISTMFKNGQFNGEILQRFFGETPAFWKKVSWGSAITMFISLAAIAINDYVYKFMPVTLQTIALYLVVICFFLWGAAKMTTTKK